MEIWIDRFNVAQRDGLVQQLLIEWKRKSSVKTVAMKYSNAQYSSHKVEVREMIGIYA